MIQAIPNLDILKSCKIEHNNLIKKDLMNLIKTHAEKRIDLMKDIGCLPDNFVDTFESVICLEITNLLFSLVNPKRSIKNDIM